MSAPVRRLMDRTLGPLRELWEGLLDLAYPPCCLHCRARIEHAASAEPDLPLCPRCLLRLERAAPEALAAELERLPHAAEALDGAFALWMFDKEGPLQQVQHALKYGNRPRYGVLFGRLVGRAYAEAPHPPPDGVLPVPLHPVRFYERGYNQSAALARGIASALRAPLVLGGLRRTRSTRSQTKLSRPRRWTNVAGAFCADAPAVRGRTLLLVDDVPTTGATATAAAQAIKQAGAHRVHLATLALARG